MNNRFLGTSQKWEAEIKAAQEELRLHGHEMSPYERNVISREIKRRQDELIPVVGAQVIGEFKNAIRKYQDSLATVDAERAKEINRFDTVKFNAELQTLNTRVKLALEAPVNPLRGKDKPTSARLEEIYNEAIQSGDLHKQRAALETFKSLPSTGNAQERIAINGLAKKAEQTEFAFRQTEGTLKAQQERRGALQELEAKHEKLNKVSEILGMGNVNDPFNIGPFAKAAKLVQRDPHSGEILIYKETDPEVTRVFAKAAPQTAG